MQPFEDELAELRARLARYPVDKYPVQHATCLFHLGTLLLQADCIDDALAALATAESGFAACGMSLERAKATNMRGVALRTAGDAQRARESFERAVQDFHTLEKPVEEAAAAFNLGLVCTDRGDVAAARAALALAEELFAAAGRTAQAAAAARELGGLLLKGGEVAAAIETLAPAVRMALRGGDTVGAGATANALGLAHLARDDVESALKAFQDALSAHPRSVRPAEYAMVKANLALAHERKADTARAWLAAQQALGVGGAEEPSRAQARQLLDRLPEAAGGTQLFVVLDQEPPPRWPAIVGEEVLRWADGTAAIRRAAATAWVDGQLRHEGLGYDLAETLLRTLLVLPPSAFHRVVAALVEAVGRRSLVDADRFRAVTRSAMARFPIPQWQRLAAMFDEVALEQGQPADWK